MQFLIVLLSVNLVFAQNLQNDFDKIFNTSFTDEFFDENELVTQAPLRSFAALTKCGEGEQFERFTCVPYYNCNPVTNTVELNPDNDGSNKIEIRIRSGEDDNFKCDHYLEVCCQLPNNTITQDDVVSSSPKPIPTIRPNPQNRTFCGIRNAQGLDFNLIERTNEALFGEFPWMVAILKRNPSRGQPIALCGGALITPRVVLTGAHCVHNIDTREMKIRAGEWDTQTTNERIPHQERNVIQKIVRHDFIRGNLYNDVALLILERSLARADNVGTICLPEQDQLFNSRDCFATGWGKDKFGTQGQYAVILKKIQLPLVQRRECERALQKTRLGNAFGLHKSFICAGGEPGIDTCTGDGGSPLVCPDPNNPGRYVQVGMVAWGIGCGEDQVPGVYVDVTKYRQWIDTKLQGLNISSRPYQ